MNTLCDFMPGMENITKEIVTKKCIKCLIELPIENFAIRQHITNGGSEWRFNYCKACKYKEVNDVSRLRKIHPLPNSPTYECLGCERTEFVIKENGSEYGNRTVWRLHHNHITGEFEGYFCDDCNVSMGRAQDNPEILRNLANCLERKNNGFKTIY